MNIFIIKILLNKNKLLVIVCVILLLSACAVVDNQFCKQSGYMSGTYPYYDCIDRYKADIDAYKYCKEIYNFDKESPAQEQCIRERIPAIRKTFENDKNKCLYESKIIFSVSEMYPLSSIALKENDIFNENIKTYIFQSKKDANLSLIGKRKKYMDKCLQEKGWNKTLQFLKYDFNGLDWKAVEDVSIDTIS